MDWISAGIFYVEEIIWNKNGSIVDEVFCTVSNKVGDYSQMLLISWMVSMRQESRWMLPVWSYCLMSYYILGRIWLQELYRATYVRSRRWLILCIFLEKKSFNTLKQGLECYGYFYTFSRMVLTIFSSSQSIIISKLPA